MGVAHCARTGIRYLHFLCVSHGCRGLCTWTEAETETESRGTSAVKMWSALAREVREEGFIYTLGWR